MIIKMKPKDIRTEFLPSALEIIESPASPLGKLTIWMIFLILVTAILWSIIGSVDEVALARGKVIPDGNIKIIQSLEGGVITQIHVTEGQKVKKGQLLIEVDTSINKTELEKLKSSLDTAKLERELLLATLKDDDVKVEKLIKENPNLLLSEDVLNRQKEYKRLKEQDYREKQKTYQLEYEKAMEEYNMVQQQLIQLETNIKILKDQVRIQKTLYEGGAIPEQEYIEKQNELDFAIMDRDLQLAKIAYYEDQLEVNQNQKDLHTLDYDKEIMKELVEKDKAIQELEKEVDKMTKRIDLQKIIAPVDGTVQGMGANTIGGVITSANPIISIVPDATPLLIEAMVLNKDIGFIQQGQGAEIKLDTFPFQKYGTIKGKIIHISADAVEDENLGYVYKILVKPEKETIFVDTRDVPISPGMAVLTEVKTGKRKIIEFFLPAADYIKDSFKLR
ncbi:MAG: HlyD family type I secretion periplasmic adaptor subunit [Bacillota bacterium]